MKRNYGIDLLRMTAMGFVIVLHLVGLGGICINAPLFGGNFFLSQFIRIATNCAVNVYALISGYVGWDRRPKVSSLLNLWLKVICFCVGCVLLVKFLVPDRVGWMTLLKALFPVTRGTYWYFSAYVALFFFMPILNHAIRHLSGREALLAMGGLTLIVASLPLCRISDIFQLGAGYSAWWLVLLYLGGGFLSRFRIPQRAKKWHWAALYLCAVLACMLPRMFYLWLKPELWTPDNQNLMVQYTSPTIILASVALVCLFALLELKEPALRLVSKLSPHCFGVYLFHTHPLVFETALLDRFAWLGTAPMWELLGVLFGVSLVIYAVGTVLDLLLSKILGLLGVDRLLKKLDARLVP